MQVERPRKKRADGLSVVGMVSSNSLDTFWGLIDISCCRIRHDASMGNKTIVQVVVDMGGVLPHACTAIYPVDCGRDGRAPDRSSLQDLCAEGRCHGKQGDPRL